jgi:dTDP-4-dehydrorhamnose 3,5-epimerase
VEFRELAVPHAWEITPVQRADDRGVFLELYRADLLADATGRTFELKQGNVSVSKRGVGRGIHWADVGGAPDQRGADVSGGQAKYFSVIAGSATDYIVDIRVGSPTYGTWDSVELDDRNRRAVFLSEGLGHLFVVTSESATVSYQINDYYNPTREHAVSALDPALALPLADLILSPQDAAAPTLAEARDLGILPTWDACLAHYASLAVAK